MRALGEAITHSFTQVLCICDGQGLSGRALFAIDGVKLPSNAEGPARYPRRLRTSGWQARSRRAGDTRAPSRHRAADERDVEPDLAGKEKPRIERLKHAAAPMREWRAEHRAARRGAKGSLRKRNRTDHDSAKMATSKGVIQGYTGARR